MYNDYIGKPKNTVRQEKLVSELCTENVKFHRWFNDKFLKWEYDPMDRQDAEVLSESVTVALLERYSQ